MSGLFGAIGCGSEVTQAFRDACVAIWPHARVAEPTPKSLLGSQGFGELAGLYHHPALGTLAVDGEAHLFHRLNDADTLFSQANGEYSGYQSKDGFAGNIASINANGHCAVYCHESGLFPLYYARSGTGVLFASQIRPLASALDHCQLDHAGIIQFLGEGYNFAGRTAYQQIKRFLPGQRLIYRADGGFELKETSELWARPADDSMSESDAADEFWHLLTHEVSADLALEQGDITLMMSGGWDSRTLLAAYLNRCNGHKPRAYFHGDNTSREHHIVQQICGDHDVHLQSGTLDDELWSIDFLQQAFNHNENLIFPHWHRAGDRIDGAGPVSAGIFGEVPGGHYGTSQLGTNTNRLLSVAGKLFDFGLGDHPVSPEALNRVREQLFWSDRMFYWYVNDDFRSECRHFQQTTNADIEQELGRLLTRGISTVEQLVEAFISEHRGAFYAGAQLLSAGHNRGISIPFARSNMLQRATQFPLVTKVHNKVNKHALQTHSPAFGNYPSAATLVALKRPLIVQEASRAARKVYETAKNKAYRVSGGSMSKARIEWVNFDFLVERPQLIHQLVDDLQADIWNTKEMHAVADRISAGQLPESGHHVYDQFNKIYTIDNILRG